MISSQFLSRFEIMQIGNVSATNWDEPVTGQSIVAKFPSLRNLAIRGALEDYHAQPLADQMRELCKLEKLERFFGGYCNRDDQHPSFGEMFGMESSASATTPRFQSLTLLSLDIRLRRSDDFHSIFDTPQLEYMFPVLRMLEFKFLFATQCTSCGDAYKKKDLRVRVVQNKKKVRSALRRCAKKIINPWRHYCPSLQDSKIICHFNVSHGTDPLFVLSL